MAARRFYKVDKKGRVSVPAGFRAAIADQLYQGVVLFPSAKYQAIEGFDGLTMENISSRLDEFDMFSSDQDDLATSIFGESIQLAFDGDGRIVLPQHLIKATNITDQAAFVGLGRKFQIWSPELLAARKSKAKNNVKEKSLIIPKSRISGGADGNN